MTYIVKETACYPCSFQVFDPKGVHLEYVAAKMAGELD